MDLAKGWIARARMSRTCGGAGCAAKEVTLFLSFHFRGGLD